MSDLAHRQAQVGSSVKRHDWPRVGTLATRLLSSAPDHAPAHYFAGIAWMEQRQPTQSLRHLRRAAELDPARVEYAVQFARVLSFLRLSREALAATDRALGRSP